MWQNSRKKQQLFQSFQSHSHASASFQYLYGIQMPEGKGLIYSNNKKERKMCNKQSAFQKLKKKNQKVHVWSYLFIFSQPA